MSNQKNLEALRKLLVEWGERRPDERLKSVGSLSEWLAEHGVLIPSAITDDELVSCVMPQAQVPAERAKMAAFMRERLERIGKGAPPPHRPDTPADARSPVEGMRGDAQGTSIIRPPETSDPS